MLHKVVQLSCSTLPNSLRPLPQRSLCYSYPAYQLAASLNRSVFSAATAPSAASSGAPQSTAAVTPAHMEPYDSQWINHWKEGVDPGTRWDAGKCSPILAKILAGKEIDVVNKRVLVPGCGRGYDVFCFAQAGAAAAVGLDLSEEAVAEAEAEKTRVLLQHPEAAARSELVSGNFFKYQHQSGQQFDVGYDYTFLCALHPDMRCDWAQAWSNLLAPGGELITLIFPVGPGFVGNPPWQVSPELYQELLLPAGFEQVVLEPVPTEFSHKGREGREWLGRWRRIDSSSNATDRANFDDGQHNSSTKSKM